MADATNARLWTNAAVWVSFDLDETDPADIDADFAGGWEEVGLLDGDDGFVTTREEDVTDHFAWGGILVRTGRSHFKLTKKFTAYEVAGDTVFALQWPGSTAGESIMVPTPTDCRIAFETIEGTYKQRLISTFKAQVAPDGDVTETESDPAKITFVANIFPDTTDPEAPQLFTVQETTGS